MSTKRPVVKPPRHSSLRNLDACCRLSELQSCPTSSRKAPTASCILIPIPLAQLACNLPGASARKHQKLSSYMAARTDLVLAPGPTGCWASSFGAGLSAALPRVSVFTSAFLTVFFRGGMVPMQEGLVRLVCWRVQTRGQRGADPWNCQCEHCWPPFFQCRPCISHQLCLESILNICQPVTVTCVQARPADTFNARAVAPAT